MCYPAPVIDIRNEPAGPGHVHLHYVATCISRKVSKTIRTQTIVKSTVCCSILVAWPGAKAPAGQIAERLTFGISDTRGITVL